MKAFVLVKQVPDTETQIKIQSDKSWIEEGDIKWVMNPYCEFALEDALRQKEAGKFEEVVAVSVGPARVADTLRSALAVGCARAIHVETESWVDSFTTGSLLAEAIKKEDSWNDSVIYSGKLAIDDDCAQVPQVVAEKLDLAHISVVLKYDLDGSTLNIQREIGGASLEKYQAKAPSIIGAQKSMNGAELRYAKVPDILKAKKKEVKKLTPGDLGVDTNPKVKYFDFELPPERGAVKMIEGDASTQAKELVKLLREEAKVI